MEAIVDIDLLAFETGDRQRRRAMVDGVMHSLRTGFVYSNHDIPGDVLDAAYEALATFFSLPASAKERYRAPASHGQTGYTGLLVETAAGQGIADWKEMLNWGPDLSAGHPLRRKYPHRYRDQVLPEDAVPGITAILGEYHRRLLDLQRRFLRLVAVGLGCAEGFFEDLLLDGSTLNRAVRYPSMEAAPRAGHVWAAEHGDINLITALVRATAPGLQVRTDTGWVDALPPEGSAVLNTGIMLERLSNGLIPTGIHRVVAGADHRGDRLSVVQFCHPAPWYILSPLASCVGAERPLRYGTIEAGDLLDRVLWEIRLMD